MQPFSRNTEEARVVIGKETRSQAPKRSLEGDRVGKDRVDCG